MSEDYWDYEKAFQTGQRSHHAQGGGLAPQPAPIQPLSSTYNGNTPVAPQVPVAAPSTPPVAPGTTLSGGTPQVQQQQAQTQQGTQFMKEGGHAGHHRHSEHCDHHQSNPQNSSVLYGVNNDRELLTRGNGRPAPFVSPRNEDYNSAKDKNRNMPLKGLGALSIMIGMGGERHKHAEGDTVDSNGVPQQPTVQPQTGYAGGRASTSVNPSRQAYDTAQQAKIDNKRDLNAQYDQSRNNMAAGGVAKERLGGYKGTLPKPKNNLADNGY